MFTKQFNVVKPYVCLLVLLLAFAVAAGSGAEEERTAWMDGDVSCRVITPGRDWLPFRFDWRELPDEPVWGDFGIDAPAGKYGFLKASGAVFQAGNRRIRLWGCCLSGGHAATPGRREAVLAAKFLRQRGYNAVRLTHLDASWGKPLDDRRGATPMPDPERMDRFFFFLNELKKNGIYYVLDGIHDFDFPGHVFTDWNVAHRRAGAKFLINFSKQLQEYHNDYLKKFLTATNPYTKLALADDPALAGIQLVNEAFLLRSAQNFKKYSDFPPSVREELRGAWNGWRGELGMAEADFDAADPAEQLRFYGEMSRRNFRRMYRMLREEFGVKSPIATTSCYVGVAMLPLALDGDFTEGHAYYSHPTGGKVDGKPMRMLRPKPGYYNGDYRTFMPFLLSQRIGYQPYIVGEWNSSSLPSRFDLPLQMSALANIQDIDGAFLFQMLQARWEDSEKRGIDIFGTIEDPGVLVNMIPAAIAWHRNYVSRAERELGVVIPARTIYGIGTGSGKPDAGFGKTVDAEGNVVEEVNTNYSYSAYSQATYLFRVFALPEAEGAKKVPDQMLRMPFSASVARSFPKEFARARAKIPYSQKQNSAAINTPRYAAVWGVLGGEEHHVGPLTVKAPAGEEFSVSAVSLDDLPLEKSGRILIAVASAACARDLQLLERRDRDGNELPRAIWKNSVVDPVMRPIDAELSLRGVVGKAFRVSIAGAKGEAVAEAVRKNGSLSWRMRPADGSCFFLLER